MFNLEKAISDWRQKMRAEGIEQALVLDELESHLQEDIAAQIREGADEKSAIDIAIRRVGDASQLKQEFNKIVPMKWNRPLAFTAWCLFLMALFLPAGTSLSGNVRGWEFILAAPGAIFSWNLNNPDWLAIHCSLLTFSALFMIASPFLFAVVAPNSRTWRWVRRFNSCAWIFVGSFFVRWFVTEGLSGARIGFSVWTASFLLLWLSTLKRPTFLNGRFAAAN